MQPDAKAMNPVWVYRNDTENGYGVAVTLPLVDDPLRRNPTDYTHIVGGKGRYATPDVSNGYYYLPVIVDNSAVVTAASYC
jgi:hypothetical protein